MEPRARDGEVSAVVPDGSRGVSSTVVWVYSSGDAVNRLFLLDYSKGPVCALCASAAPAVAAFSADHLSRRLCALWPCWAGLIRSVRDPGDCGIAIDPLSGALIGASKTHLTTYRMDDRDCEEIGDGRPIATDIDGIAIDTMTADCLALVVAGAKDNTISHVTIPHA